jgi:3',5'-cyclic AMP phosphodiesterase CpdA
MGTRWAALGLLLLVGCTGAGPKATPAPESTPAPAATGEAEVWQAPVPATINGKPLPGDPDGPWSALLIGHAYGYAKDRYKDRPSRSLTRNVDLINALRPHVVALLGDNLGRPTRKAADALRKQFTVRLDAPVLALPGEHDLFEGADWYESNVGPRFQRLRVGKVLLVFLDSGTAKSSELGPRQERFFRESMDIAEGDSGIRTVVVLMHKVLYVRAPRYSGLVRRINNDRKGGFWAAIHPRLSQLAADKQVLVGAGDIGHKSYSFFADHNPDDGITYFATGLTDGDQDTLARLDFDAEGTATVSAVSLTDQPVRPDEATLDGYARSHPAPRGPPPGDLKKLPPSREPLEDTK